MRRRELFANERKELDESKRYREYQHSPYYGRIDLEEDDGTSIKFRSYYIGKEGIQIHSEPIVVDWRSDIGGFYGNESKKEFSVNGISYVLQLRRSLDVKNKKLIDCITTYDRSDEYQADVTDPFLLRLLDEKRSDRKLTDIIRTISETQNEIIRKPRTESFAVQGCAGSGKTMILLHRLSVLLFNNKGMNLSGIKIITPNKFFDAYIDDLSTELGLTKIKRFSVEEYYVSLIKSYSSDVSVSARNVKSEKTLNPELMKVVYSTDYMNNSVVHYHNYWNRVLETIDEERLKKLYSAHRLRYPDTLVHNYDTVLAFEQGISHLMTIVEGDSKTKKELSNRIELLEKSISDAQEKYDQEKRNLEIIQEQIAKRLEEEKQKAQASVQKAKEKISNLQSQCDALERRKKQEQSEESETQSSIRDFTKNREHYTDYDQFLLCNDELYETIKERCKEQIGEIIRNEQNFQKVPSYNFSKKGRMLELVERSKKDFSRAVKQFLDNYLRDMQAQADLLRESIMICDEELATAKKELNSEVKNLQQRQTSLASVDECISVFGNLKNSDSQLILSKEAKKQYGETFSVYTKQRAACDKAEKKLNSDKNAKELVEAERQRRLSKQVSAGDVAYINECRKIVERLRWGSISRNVMFADLRAIYKTHNQEYTKTNYRHKIYLALLYVSLYFPRSTTSDYFLNIDEAQDISVAEYCLLKNVLGDKCVFNLYGDVNQLVYDYKGIDNWEDVPGINEGNVYLLSQNYRNTTQITDFCNMELGAQITPIGLTGAPVVEMNTENAVHWILEVKMENPAYRVAILYRYGLKAIQDRLHVLLHEQDVIWDAVDDKKLSVISVETAKGLEFDAVVVIADHMTINERYISYTRALDNLVVVRDSFSEELISDTD